MSECIICNMDCCSILSGSMICKHNNFLFIMLFCNITKLLGYYIGDRNKIHPVGFVINLVLDLIQHAPNILTIRSLFGVIHCAEACYF